MALIAPQATWLWTKIFGLLIYILVGAAAMRTSGVKAVSFVFFLLALLTFCWIVSVAMTKSPLGFLVFVTGRH